MRGQERQVFRQRREDSPGRSNPETAYHAEGPEGWTDALRMHDGLPMAALHCRSLHRLPRQPREAALRNRVAGNRPQELQDVYRRYNLHHPHADRAAIRGVLLGRARRCAFKANSRSDIADAALVSAGLRVQGQQTLQDSARHHHVQAEEFDIRSPELFDLANGWQTSKCVLRGRGRGVADQLRRRSHEVGPAQHPEQARLHHLDKVPDDRQPFRGRVWRFPKSGKT